MSESRHAPPIRRHAKVAVITWLGVYPVLTVTLARSGR